MEQRKNGPKDFVFYRRMAHQYRLSSVYGAAPALLANAITLFLRLLNGLYDVNWADYTEGYCVGLPYIYRGITVHFAPGPIDYHTSE